MTVHHICIPGIMTLSRPSSGGSCVLSIIQAGTKEYLPKRLRISSSASKSCSCLRREEKFPKISVCSGSSVPHSSEALTVRARTGNIPEFFIYASYAQSAIAAGENDGAGSLPENDLNERSGVRIFTVTQRARIPYA